MAQLRNSILSSLFFFASLASHGATGIFRERLIPGPPGGVTGLATVTVTDLVFTEFDANRIGLLTRDGQFQEFVVPTPDTGPRGVTFVGFPQAIWFTEFKAGKIGRLTLDGSFTEFSIPSPRSAPWGIAEVGGEIWFTESAANKIGRVNKDGSITEFAIPTGAAGPRGIAGGPYGAVCFAEFGADQIGCLENGRIIERGLTPGSGPQGISHDGGIGLWFTESAGNRVGVVSFDSVTSLAQARIEEFSIPTPASEPFGVVAESSRGAWFTERSAGQVGFVSSDGRITEYPLSDRSSRPAEIVASFFGAQFLEPAANRIVEIQPDAVVLPGVGSSGPWDTQLQVSNVTPRPVTVFAGIGPKPPSVCGFSCFPSGLVSLPANGSGQLNFRFSGLFTLFVRALEEGNLPSVRGRIYNHNFPSQSVDLPAIRLSTLTSLNPSTLFFPGAVRSGLARTNLLISELRVESLVLDRQPGTMRVRVDLIASDGTQLSSEEFVLVAGTSLYLVDVIGRLGVTTLRDGQIRVSRVGPEGRLWGYMATVNEDGAISIFSGVNP